MRILIKEFPSKSSNAIYKVHQDDQTGKLDCECKGWRFSGENRGCCHTKDVIANYQNLLSVKINSNVAFFAQPVSTKTKVTKKKALDDSTTKALTGLTVPGLALPYFSPMLAKESTPELVEERMESNNFIAEVKWDGARYLCYVTSKGNRFFSRRISVKDNMPVEKTDNVPHLRDYNKLEVGTILDGEILPATGSFTDTTKVMGSLPEEAIEKQKTLGKMLYRVFDILYYKGECLMRKSLRERIEYLKKLSYNQYFLAVDRVEGASAKRKLLKDVYARGGEGIILKNINGIYVPGKRDKDIWMKCKKVKTYDVVVTGYEEPKQFSINVNGETITNKHWARGHIAAIKFGAFKKGQLVEVGMCGGGMDDATREEISKNKNKYLNKVMEIEGQEFLENAIRFPQFVRFRDDKRPQDCKYDDLL